MTVYSILAGGPTHNVPDLKEYEHSVDHWIGVDKGAYHLISNGIHPLISFGDYDSLADQELEELKAAGAELLTYPEEKDKTDLELALDWVLEQKPSACYIFGATGGRLDHEMAAIHLLKKGLTGHSELKMIDNSNLIQLVGPGKHKFFNNSHYPYFSLLSLSEAVEDLTVTGVKYPLANARLNQSVSLGVSNIVTEPTAEITFHEGLLLVIRSRDEK